MTPSIAAHVSADALNDASVDYLVAAKAASRLRNGDANLWGPAARAEAADRLGWVNAALEVDEVLDQAQELRDELAPLEYEQVLLCGMGGSSLSPQVMTVDAPVPLIAVDSIHPDFLHRVCTLDALLRSVIVVSSKSGGTSETRTQLALCEHLLREAGANPADRIVVITDPESELEEYARLRGYRTVIGNPRVGGRYSALTVFGLVPSVLAGADLHHVVQDVRHTLRAVSRDSPDNPAIRVASALGLALQGSGTAQFVTRTLSGIPEWIEQLIAESTGKQGRGLLPLPRTHSDLTDTGGIVVATEAEAGADADLQAAHPPAITVTGSLGAQFYFWEVVTALMCAIFDVNPFDQPDVERTKRAARAMKPGQGLPPALTELAPGLALTASLTSPPASDLDAFVAEWISAASTAPYVAVQAFIPGHNPLLHELGTLTEQLTGTPCAVSHGPAYLHSTGQLHKGGRPGGVFMNIYQTPEHDIAVPSTITTFGWLCAAASLADQQVLRGLGRSLTGLRITNEKALEPVVQRLRSLALQRNDG